MSRARLCDSSLSGLLLLCATALLSGCGGGSGGNTPPTPPTTSNQWTWVNGNNSYNPPRPANTPSARADSTTWIDASGNLWLFGGDFVGTSSSGAIVTVAANDLWKFDPMAQMWSRVTGTDNPVNSAGSYGTQGTASPSNIPGARYGAVSWIDSNGNLLFFGGYGYGYTNAVGAGQLNDLWGFSPTTGLWTWLGGSDTLNQSGTYGTQGMASTSNIPGGRSWPGSWTDHSGKLWLFGGESSISSKATLLFNDLWQFDPSTKMWTWAAGSNSTNQAGAYTGAVMPGAREQAVTWTDANGNLWLFGGSGFDSNDQLGDLNDLWKFNPTTAAWTFVGGGITAGQGSVYGKQGTPSSSNIPGARSSALAWTDTSGNLWMFGGYISNQTAYLNDLWEFNPATTTWTWVGGSNTTGQTGVYGTQGTPSTSNVPGARRGAAGWSDPKGAFWLFGGVAADASATPPLGYFNDLWRYTP